MGELYACVLGAITLTIFFAERGIHDSDSLAGRKTECCSGASGNMGCAPTPAAKTRSDSHTRKFVT